MTTSAHYDKFQKLLAELFMFDQADLDFGIYRIMNAKRGEIDRFLQRDLLPQVRETLGALQSGDRASLEAELHKAVEAAKSLGVDPESSPKVQQLRGQLAEAGDLDALEAEVFSDLYNFFRRYYREGDFISQRRYKEGVYAIPYEGEEVKLHWANHDQYYIKSTENFRDYTFKLRDGRRVHFKLIVADTERDNNRAANGNDRRFILCADDPLIEQNGELLIRFEYRPDADGRKQDQLNADSRDRVFAAQGFGTWTDELMTKAPTGANPDRTLLERHLTEYTARNTFDYFIHKNLSAFLRRELDFYIKNEIVHLDDIENEAAPRVEQYLAKVRAIRRIAHKIIDFLAQIEDFQKRLWLKKKFVVESSYCIAVGCIPDKFYSEIAANEAQREEWVRLFAIDNIAKDLTSPGYSVPLTASFLASNPTLVVDTRLFPSVFLHRLLAAVPDLDAEVDAVLINADNFPATHLVASRYRKSVRVVYTDPPYNTGADGFIYRDQYQHSSWLAMMSARLQLAEELLDDQGSMFISIDEHEAARLVLAATTQLQRGNHITNIIWQKVDSPNDNKVPLTPDHEYVVCISIDPLVQQFQPKLDPSILEAYKKDQATGKLFRDRLLKKNGANSRRIDRPTMYFPITDPDGNPVLPIHDDGSEACWSLGKPAVERLQASGDLVWKRRVVAGVERWEPYTREFAPDVPTRPYPTIWDDVKTMRQAKAQMKALFGRPSEIETVKPTQLVERILALSGVEDQVVFDPFAGSGTTGHAVINANRGDGKRRRFVLMEMGDHFETNLLPRIKKVAFTPEWADGKPSRPPTQEEAQRSPRITKVIRLESYEDALNNLVVTRREDQKDLLDNEPALREDYTLRYMLGEETKGSPSLLNVRLFENPFNYRMKIATGTVGETKDVAVDLVETFNWLLGLRVKHIDTIRGVRVVEGKNPDGERVLVIWRNTKEIDSDTLDEWFTKQGYNTRDQEYDIIYVNGDNNLENLRRADQTWKVRMTEDEFHRLMFDVQDV